MPDFLPNGPYVREMKKYGALPADYDPATKKWTMNQIDDSYFDITWQDAWPEEIRKSVFGE